MKMQFLNVKQVAAKYAVSTATIWRWVRKGEFPEPVKLNPQVVRWPDAELEKWEASRGIGTA